MSRSLYLNGGASAVTKKGIAEAVLYRYGEYAKRTVICCTVWMAVRSVEQESSL